jgi:nucleoside-diphosphate-sugar epimerase
MVIGTGLLAKGLSSFNNDDENLIFASGVSNSQESNKFEFDREFQLLKVVGDKFSHMRLVYFSTCSISDLSLNNSFYINHKKNIEKYIIENISSYVVIRLPNVVGFSDNPYTFFNYFKNKILFDEEILVQSDASRYLIDLRDIVRLIPIILKDDVSLNSIINMAFQNQMSVIDIIKIYENVLNLKAKVKIIPGGSSYEIDNKLFLEILNSNSIDCIDNYNYSVLKFYLK